MCIDGIKEKDATSRFLHWIRERDQILKRRRAGKPKPWTEDPILQSYYFCNVRREDDKVTTWLRENIRDPLKNDPAVLFAVIAFRWFNYIPTGEKVLAYPNDYRTAQLKTSLFCDWDTSACVAILKGSEQIFTGAFNISNSGSTKPKINRVCEDYIQPVWKDRKAIIERVRNSDLQRAHTVLKAYPGLGGSGFMAAQVVADLKYTYLLKDAKDWWTWCSPGPGSKRGLNRLNGLPIDTPLPKDWSTQINEMRALVKRKLRIDLHAQDLQNCLCEYDKMERALWADGHLKRRYNGCS